MGGGSFTHDDWVATASVNRTKTRSQIFTNSVIHKDMNPHGVQIREARDSDEHPESCPIIVALDETGSMGHIPEAMVKDKLGVLVNELLARKPVNDPQLLFAGIGDVYCDRAPLQVGQFESDIRMADWLSKIYLEANGGGNGGESYTAIWYFAALHTSTDHFEKRGKKGYLFTIGDEHYHDILPKQAISKFIGDNVERDYTAEELLTMAQRLYNVFHIGVKQGSGWGQDVEKRWKALLNERLLVVDDYDKIAEVIVSTIQIIEGADSKDVAASWSGDTSLVVAKATGQLTKESNSTGVTRF